MQISNRIASNSTSDSLAYLATKAAGKEAEEKVDDRSSAHLSGGTHDPASHVSLSVDALLILSGARQEETGETLPTLTEAERNNVGTEQLAAREHAAFGHYLEAGDQKGYYRAYIDYFDSMPAEDQLSARYAGTRETAVAALRAITYAERVHDVSAPDGGDAAAQGEQQARRATPISAIFRPGQQDFENAARVSGRISRADSMYSMGF